MAEDAVIIIPTHSSYLDISKIFLKMMELYWPDAHFKIVISLTGENVKITEHETLYNGKNATLTDCVYKAVLSFPADYYFCFLGDALICKKIQKEDVDRLLKGLKEVKAQYCCLIPRRGRWKNRKEYGEFRHIFSDDIYCHSFVAFIASEDFILREMNSTTDYDFEKKYLKTIYGRKFLYERDYILTSDIFNIIQGIQKGRWNRKALKIVRRNIHDFSTDREVLGAGMTVYNAVTLGLQTFLPIRLRKVVKFLFKSKFSVEY